MDNSALDIWISGAFAVVIVDFLVYPVDTLKTRVQSPNYYTIYKDAATNTIRKSVLFRGLYQGVFGVVLSTIPASGAFFTTYESVKSNLYKSKSNSPLLQSIPSPMINALASCTGESVSCLLLTPAEVIKQNAQVINTANSNNNPSSQTPRGKTGNVTMQVLSRFKSQPWKLWSGYSALLGRNLPFTGLNFPIYEGVKGYLVERRRRNHRNNTCFVSSESGGVSGKEKAEPVFERVVLTGIAASISGSVSSVATTPIDVVKTRMMLAASGGDSSPGPVEDRGRIKESRRSVWTVGREIFRDEGLRGLFRGGAIRVVWTAVSLSIYLSIYEGGRFYLEKRRRRGGEEEEKRRRRGGEV
ncbi:mitochondrial carrier [Aspergillus californicus]